MEYKPSFRDRLYTDVTPSFSHAVTEDQKYGIPELNKFPMPDAAHVRSAIKFFNYVTPAHEQQLASAILARMEEYGISADSLNVGDKNRFKKYLQHDSLMHHGIKGQKWGVRRYQNPDGTLTPKGRKRAARKEQLTLNNLDRAKVQNMYDIERREKKAAKKVKKLENKDYRNSRNPFREDMRRASLKRHQNTLDWAKSAKNAVNEDYKEKTQKVLDRCKDQKLNVEITEGGKRWVDTHWRIRSGYAYIPIMRPYDGATKYKVSGLEHSNLYLAHHGIKGQKWGVRRFQNPDGSYTALGAANRKQLSKIDRKYDKLAKKDAKEYARAKMSYGEGAGNRRKLIKNKVEQRRKENEHYNKVFDEYLAQEDMSKHADAAKRERTVKDAAKTTKKAAKTAVKVFNTVAPLL